MAYLGRQPSSNQLSRYRFVVAKQSAMSMTSDLSPRVSVVMPTYNVEAYVEEATRSILQQTFTDFEFIIIDDGSTDGTWAILERLAAQDARIRLARNPSNRGISYTRNRGTELARGEYIAVMDSDDICLPDRFEKQVAYLDAHPEVGVVGGALRSLHGKTLGHARPSPLTPGLIAWTMCFDLPIGHPTALIRRSVLLAVGGYDEKRAVSVDHDLWFRISRHAQLANLPDMVLYYRRHDSNISLRKNEQQMHSTSTIVQRAIETEIGVRLTLPEVRRWLFGIPSPSVRTAKIAAVLRQLACHIKDKYHLTPEEWMTVRQQAARRLLLVLRHKPDAVSATASLLYAFQFAPIYSVRWLRSDLWNSTRTRLVRRPLTN